MRRTWASEEQGRSVHDYQPDMPSVEGADHLIRYLWEIGPTMAAGMGAGPITHGELLAWQMLTGIKLEPWESRFLRRLSQEYLVESQRAEKRDARPPWVAEPAKPPVTDLQAALRALAAP